MSLRYSFRHLFYGGKIQKERLYKVLEDLDASNGGDEQDISTLKTTVGNSSSGLVKDMSDVKSAIGTDDTTEGSLKKRCKDIETAIGTDDTTSGSLKKRCKEIETAIGDESTEGTILARIKALEDAE